MSAKPKIGGKVSCYVRYVGIINTSPLQIPYHRFTVRDSGLANSYKKAIFQTGASVADWTPAAGCEFGCVIARRGARFSSLSTFVRAGWWYAAGHLRQAVKLSIFVFLLFEVAPGPGANTV